jgi:hypothetical protein
MVNRQVDSPLANFSPSSRRAFLRSTRAALCAVPLVAIAVLLAPAFAKATVNPVLTGSVSNSTTLPGVDSVAVAGSYAYVTDYYAGRLSAIDMSLPSAPFIAGSSASSSDLMNGDTVNIAGGYAFVVSKNRNGAKGSGSNDDGTGNSLTILDIHTNPAEPTIVGSVHDSNSLFGAYGIAVSGNYAYVASQGCLSEGEQPCPNPSAGNDLDVIEIAGPEAPKIVATLSSTSEPQAFSHVTAVAIAGSYAYLTASYQQRLTVVNIANPEHPELVTSLRGPTNLPFPVDVTISGSYAYVINQNAAGPLAVVDISNPKEPKVVGALSGPALAGGYRIRVRGKMAYVSASQNAGVAVVDISNPLSPRLLASYSDPTHLHSTTGLDLDPTGSYVVATSTYLPTQHKPNFPPYTLEAGGPELEGTVSVIALDPEPIEAAIAAESEPANPTAQTSASFAFSINDAVATAQCRLDAGAWTQCTTPTSQSYTALSEGSHSFQVQATGSAGDTSTATYDWTVTAPPTNITSPGGSSTGSGSTGAGGTGGANTGGGETGPTTAEIQAALLGAVQPGGKLGRIASVREHRGYRVTFDAPAGGAVVISWYEIPKGAHLASAKFVLVASGRATFTAKSEVKLTLKLTTRGKSLLKHARQVKLTARATFTPAGRSPVTVTRSFTLR